MGGIFIFSKKFPAYGEETIIVVSYMGQLTALFRTLLDMSKLTSNMSP